MSAEICINYSKNKKLSERLTMNVLFTTIAAILIFAVLIFVHEFGHFITAKLSGIKVNEFALGMGPKLFSFKKGETLYSLRAVPIGGFCAMEGEDENTDDPRAFNNKSPYKRLFVLISGAFMNILLGFILILGISLSADKVVVAEVLEVLENSPAQTAGLLQDDKIIRANGKRIHISEDLSWEISNNTNENAVLNLTLENNGEKRDVSIAPENTDGKLSYGIMLKVKDNSVIESVKKATYKTFFYSEVILDSFVNLVKGEVPLSQVSGPVGIVTQISDVVEETKETGMEGFLRLLSLATLLTINLGVFNLIPLPALDGGRILFVLVEMILRKPVPREKEALVHFIGLLLLLLFSVFIALKDIFMLF